MRRICICLTLLALCILPATATGDTFYPMLMGISPVAVQVGSSTECEAEARYNLHGAYKVFVTGDGVAGEIMPPKTELKPSANKPQRNKIGIRFKVAADAVPGVREVRIATPQGVSTVGQLVIARDPIVRETPNNDTMNSAQPVEFPATLCGAFEKAEDVDFFRFKAKAGSSLTFHVRSQRLQDKIHDLQEHSDPILTLRNSGGSVLAVNDNYFFADPLLHYKFAADGDYFLEIRDVRYGGNVNWQYCIEVNDRPFVTNVHPMRVSPGKTNTVELIGYNLPVNPKAALTLPDNAPDGPLWAVLTDANGHKTNAAPVVVCRLPDVLEAPGDNNTAAKAQPITVPAGISGRIESEGDIDCYAFEAKAGEKFAFEVLARGHQSAIDPFIRILNEKGDRLAENDDFADRFVHADSRIESWTAPANGRYVVEIRDTHLRGGPAFVYFLKVTRAEPFFTLELDTDKTLLAPGNASTIYARVTRKNGFQGEVRLAIEGLPPGVSAQCGRVLPAGRDGCIILKAVPDAKIGASNIRVTGTSIPHPGFGKRITLSAVAQPLQEIYMPGGGRYHYPVETHAVSIGDPLDIRSVKLSATDVRLKPGESKRIDVAIERAKDFKQNVTLDVVYQHLGSIYGDSLPPGVSVDEKASMTLLTGEQSKGYITLKAAPDAKPVEKQQIAIMAHVSINFVMKFSYAGEPVFVSVIKP
jgi:hypothetical protein